MSKWKLQAIEPDTCDPPGCRYIELWDVEEPPPRTMQIVAFDRVCPAHPGIVSDNKMLWADGNWKDKKEYIDYQRKWFRRENHKRWLLEHPDEEMPRQISRLTSDPVTSGSVVAPPKKEIDAMNTIYAWNQEHNVRKNSVLSAVETTQGIDQNKAICSWSGIGDNRVLTVMILELTSQQVTSLQSLVDIQFGVGKTVIKN